MFEDTRIFLVNKLRPAHVLTVQWSFHNVSQPYKYTYIFIRNVFPHLYSNSIESFAGIKYTTWEAEHCISPKPKLKQLETYITENIPQSVNKCSQKQKLGVF